MLTETDPAPPHLEAIIEREEGQFRLRHSDPNDHIWKLVRDTGAFYESEFLDVIGRDLKPGDLVLDVGANIGNHSIYFAGVCDARVIAFEPNPDALTLLKENISANGLRKRIDVRDYALGAATGQADFDLSAAAGNLGAVRLTIAEAGAAKIKRLDDVKLPRPPKVLKIDAEGMDFDVLRGAEKLLAEHQPVVAVEAADRKLYNDIADFLGELGYVRRESLNYTPTHIFVPVAKGRTSQFNRHVARELGGAYVDMAAARASADQRIARISGRITSIEGSIASSSREMAAALAVDVQRVEAGIVALNTVLNTSADDSGKRIQTLDGSLIEVKTTVAGIVAKLDAQFTDTQLGLAQHRSHLERVAAQLGAVRNTTDVDISALKGNVKLLGENIGARFQSITDEYRVGQESIQRISIRVRELQSALARLTDNIGLVTQSIDVRFYETGATLKAHSDTSNLIKDKVSDLGEGLTRLAASLAEVLPQIDKRFSETAEELKLAAEANRLISSRIHGLESGLLDIAKNVSDVTIRLDQTRSEISVGLDRTAGQNEVLASAVAALDASVVARLTGMDARIDAGRSEIEQLRFDIGSRLERVSERHDASNEIVSRLDLRTADLQSALAELDDRVDQASQRAIADQEKTASLIADDQEVFQAGLGDLRRVVSQNLAATQEYAARSEETARVQFDSLSQQLAEATRAIQEHMETAAAASDAGRADMLRRLDRMDERVEARLSTIEAAAASSAAELRDNLVSVEAGRADVSQRLDRMDGRVGTRLSAIESATTNAAAQLRDKLSSVAADQKVELRDRILSIETAAARRAAEVSARLTAMEAAQGEGHARTQRMEGDILAGMEISSRMGLWIDRKVEDTQSTIDQRISESVEQVRQTLTAELRATAAAQLEMVGKAVADIMLELERRQPEQSLPMSPPRRQIDLDSPRSGAGAGPLIKPPGLLQLPYARAPKETAALPVEMAATAAPRRRGPPSAFQHRTIDADAIAGETLATIDLATSWNNLGWPQAGATLQDGGVVQYAAGAHWPGFVTARYAARSGGVIRVTVDVGDCQPGSNLIARLRNDRDEPCGPDVPLTAGINTFRVFAPERTQALKAYVLSPPPASGGVFTIKSIRIDRLDADEHQRAVRVAVGQPVLASMASIPSRRRMLLDCVNSLLAQCDRVRVFLNNYPDVPDFLNHPRIDVRRSQDWDDRGDAGKVFWIDRDREEGYRLITDDDLLFPPDFSETMCGKVQSYDNRAIFCTHGVLLRQPVRQYYDPDSRAATFHFARQLDTDATVHIGATNAMCFHSAAVNMKWSDFSYCNSADIWISLYAQRNKLPILAASRLQGWVRENTHDAPDDTIYNHSRKRTKSRMDSSLVQDAALRRAGPLTLQPTHRPKLGLAVVVENAVDLKNFIDGWMATRSAQVDWIVSLIPATSPEQFREAIGSMIIEHETHLFDSDASLEDRIQAARRLSVDLDVEATLFVTEKMHFPKAGWENAVFSPADSGERWLMLRDAPSGGTMLVPLAAQDSHFGIAFVDRSFCDLDLPRDVGGSNTPSLEGRRTSITSLLGKALLGVGMQAPAVFRNGRKPKGGRINDVFERVVVLNLDRRPDRWAQAQNQLQQAGITAERFSAVDGSVLEVDAEYKEYAALSLIGTPAGQRELKYSEDFYIHAESQAARIAHIEQRSGRKAVESRGAWGYLKSYRTILEQALKDQVESLLVFDDDVLLHHRTPELFEAVSRQLPEDWLLLQLGTLQYNWKSPWFEPVSENLYRTRGSAIGSHAAGIRFEMMPYLLDHASRMDMPFDVGALSAATQAFCDRSFITLPNIAIQRLGAGSDINTSGFQKQADISEIANKYRWNLGDYFPDII